jgi:hypothetical protein
MKDIKIKLINGDLTKVDCSIVFIKHIEESFSRPEKTFNTLLQNALFNQYDEQKDHLLLPCAGTNSHCQFIYIINFHKKDLPFRYASVEKYARKIVEVVRNDNTGISGPIRAIATAIHGPGAGLDASEAMETFLVALANELYQKNDFGDLEEIFLVEKDKAIFERLEERVNYLISKGIIKFSKGEPYLMPVQNGSEIESLQQLAVSPSSNHVFIAMPFAREFNNTYYFGIKQTVEKFNRKSERTDQDKFVGDIVERIKARIKSADLIIADITGHNPNVFYEVGLADGLGKKIILISQAQEIPFDFKTQNQIQYDNMDILALSTKLEELLSVLLG